eukprot:1732668-Pyramimonas_sp.AAC.1
MTRKDGTREHTYFSSPSPLPNTSGQASRPAPACPRLCGEWQKHRNPELIFAPRPPPTPQPPPLPPPPPLEPLEPL